MSTPERSGIRIGNDEREAANTALSTHLDAGRLDAEEYGERYAKASMARTRDELDALFVDLPAPHAFTPMAPPKPPAPPVTARIGAFAATIVGLAPFVALALFFFTGAHFWQFFLLIPASAILMSGGRPGRRGYRNGGPRGRGCW
jgi:hypothetical protein